MNQILLDKIKTISERMTINFGKEAQFLKAAEELSECSAKINKFLNAQCGRDELSDEIADATIMLLQLTNYIGQTVIENAIEAKIDRTIDRYLTERALQEREHGGIYNTEHDISKCEICRRVALSL